MRDTQISYTNSLLLFARKVVCIRCMALSGDVSGDALGAHAPQVGWEVRMAMAPGEQAPDVDRELKACLHGPA